ncbi:B3 domain-containing protein REM16 isoform X2 [Spinacia oleracea]|uniref:B3 domain-containing protein REM16 isoform X2 n=1 Tax=Spinacia oleracea TaxID=3562 RepID=A0ABM3RLL0_SPIOL|nr:B3 domain-containing protein REM16-like isoform X2 [Spinacia oleracea]
MEDSNNRRTWEEEIYWQNFHFANFFLTLPTNFHHHLTLPKKFTEYMKSKLPEQIVLKVNRVSWNVNLKKEEDDIMFHGDGWEEFVKAYSLKKADILVFKYNRRESFEVLLFDRASLCEQEASYFVRKVQQNSDDDKEDHDRSEKTRKDLTGDKSQEDYDSESSAPRNRRKKNPASTPKSNSGRTARAKDLDDEDESDESSDEEDSISEEAKTTPNKTATAIARESPPSSSRKRKRNGDKKITGNESSFSLHQMCYRSNRREITEEEKANALTKAKMASVQFKDSFIVVMRPTCVYKRFYLTIPSDWKPRIRYRKGQQVCLIVKEKTWDCRVSFSRNNIGFQGAGWKKFARENLLEEFDVCVFVPCGAKNERSILDVSIFRVVPEAVPPTLVTP